MIANRICFLIFLSGTLILIFLSCGSPKQKLADDSLAAAAANTNTYDKAAAQYQSLCASCHGEQMNAFVDRKWKYGKTKPALFTAIHQGIEEAGMPGFKDGLSEQEINDLVDYILAGIVQDANYKTVDEELNSDRFVTEELTFELDTLFSGIDVPWSMDFLPDGDLLVTARSGELYRVNDQGKQVEINGVPPVLSKRQGGLMEVKLHPDFKKNNWVYLSYSALKDGDKKLNTTRVDRFVLKNNQLTDPIEIFTVLPYTKKNHHFGGRIAFDQKGYLYITVGDRGERDTNPQSLALGAGKVHRLYDDGRIPEDNPFVGQEDAQASIYSYGHRNPQGLTRHPVTGVLWSHEHGPRGGDELNVIEKGKNYGWPVISYGINYNGTTFTNKLRQEGMEQPLHYWVPSIAPSGMAFVNHPRYGKWQNDLLVGSLRFKYLVRIELDGNKVVKEELLMKNIGRMRDVRMGPDGYVYVAVEKPGFVFRLIPVEE